MLLLRAPGCNGTVVVSERALQGPDCSPLTIQYAYADTKGKTLVGISSYQRTAGASRKTGGGNSLSICAVTDALKQVHIAQLVRAVVKAPLSRSKGPEFDSHQLRCRVQLWASRSRIHASVTNRIGLLWC